MTDDPRLVHWLDELLSTPGLTAVGSREDAWRTHVEDALAALPFLEAGPVVDVGSGGGSPGLPLAAARPDLRFELLESSRRRCAFLERATRPFANVTVVRARAEEHGRREGRDAYGTALARALAPPPIAAEWCLPLVRPGGVLVLFAGAAAGGLDHVSEALAAAPPDEIRIPGSERRRILLFRKLGPTPERFPRRPGIARKRPLA